MQPETKIVPVVLAAGESQRMGYPKALLPLGDGTFLTRILATLAEAELPEARIVLNEKTAFLLSRRGHPGGQLILNPDPSRGQLSSMQLAVAGLERDAGACLFWPVDQPTVSAGLVVRLVSWFRQSGALITMPRCAGRGGHPVLFHRELFGELGDADSGGGAKALVMRHASVTAFVETGEESVLRDIDTPQDYEWLTGETLEAALARASVGSCPAEAGAGE